MIKKPLKMISFLKANLHPRFLTIYLLIGTLQIGLPFLLDIKFTDEGFNFGAFFFVFFLNLSPWVFLLFYMFQIRKDLRDNEEIKIGKFLSTSFVGFLSIGVTLIPLLLLFAIIVISFGLPKGDDLKETNFVLNLIYFPIMFPVMIYILGAWAQIYNYMQPNFHFKKAFLLFKKPHIKIILAWSPLFYFLPGLLKAFSFKVGEASVWLSVGYHYFKLLIALFDIFLLMYLIKSFDEDLGDIINDDRNSV